MALNVYTNNLQDLIQAGNDAHSNLYEINFQGGVFNSSEVSQGMTIRTSGFTPPQITQDSYVVKYVTAFVEWPNAKSQVTRNFTLSFRMDANWEIYEKLQEQKNKIFNASHSYASTHLNENDLFNVTVYTLKDGMSSETVASNDRKMLYQFRKCWISKVDTPSFSNSSSESIKVDCTINFLEMYDIESGFMGASNPPASATNRSSNRNVFSTAF